jgi:hypothetical protein
MRRIHEMIFAASFVIGIGAGLYFQSWAAIGLVGCAVFVVLSIAYTIIALLFGFPRLRWWEFFVDVVDFLASAR